MGSVAFGGEFELMHTTFATDKFEAETPNCQNLQIPVSVQILSTLLFGSFAIVSVIIALNMFWPAGIALAIVLGWRGGFAPQQIRTASPQGIAEKLRPLSAEAAQRSSSNASFDTYRSDVMHRLEEEQINFDRFLGRLRDAKDKSEFDRFMDDRADNARPVNRKDD